MVAVSGGLDSVVLLDVLAGRGDARLVVAHFDHGIRPDSRVDRLFVRGLAKKYELPFAYDEGRLGPQVSEAAAREARYYFLRQVKATHDASAIVTAHHEDDLLETAILNLLRGTGRRGLSSLKSTGEIWRPLLTTPKRNILAYAQANDLKWREDSTNLDTNYLRNYVRHRMLPRFNAACRRRLRTLIDATQATNDELDGALLAELLGRTVAGEVDRAWFISLPHDVSREILMSWLRQSGVIGFNRKLIERLVVQVKTLEPGKRIDVDSRYVIRVYLEYLALIPRERWEKFS